MRNIITSDGDNSLSSWLGYFKNNIYTALKSLNEWGVREEIYPVHNYFGKDSAEDLVPESAVNKQKNKSIKKSKKVISENKLENTFSFKNPLTVITKVVKYIYNHPAEVLINTLVLSSGVKIANRNNIDIPFSLALVTTSALLTLPTVLSNDLAITERSISKRVIGEEFHLYTYLSNPPFFSVASLTKGNFVIAWDCGHGVKSGCGINGQLFDIDGNKVGNEHQKIIAADLSQVSPSVSSLANSGFVVTWFNVNPPYGTRAQLYNANYSEVGNEISCSNYNNTQTSPSITSLTNGNFVVVWSGTENDDVTITTQAQIFTDAGNRVQNAFPVITTSYLQHGWPSTTVGSLAGGNFIILRSFWSYDQQSGYETYVYAQMFNSRGFKVSNEFLIDAISVQIQINSFMSIAGLINDNFVVIWSQCYKPNTSSCDICVQLFDANANKIGNKLSITTNSFDQQAFSSVAGLTNNNFVIAWAGVDQVARGVHFQLFDANGDRVGNEFIFYTNVGCQQNCYENPTVTSLSNGNFVVAWNSKSQTNSSLGYGIYGKVIATQTVANNVNQSFNYNEGVNYNLADIVITPPIFISNVTVTLTFSNTIAGSLSAGKSGSVMSIYNANNGTWQVSADLVDVNNLLAKVEFIPAPHFNNDFTINVNIDDGFNPPLVGKISATGIPAPISPSLIAPTKSTSALAAEDPNNLGLILGLVLGLGVPSLTALAATLFLLWRYKSRQNKKEQNTVELTNADTFTPDREEGKTVIGKRYALIRKITRDEAKELTEQTGIEIKFPDGENKTKPLIGAGRFGKLRIAQNVNTKKYVGVKKIKGAEEINASTQEALIQKKLAGAANIMPLLDAVPSKGSKGEDVIYQFMPLAGFGNGDTLQEVLAKETNVKLKRKILGHVAKSVLTGLAEMHARDITHLDLKTSNIVLDQQGEVFIIDFGCAAESSDINKLTSRNGDTYYFSPGRLAFCRHEANVNITSLSTQPHFSGVAADLWAFAVMMLELISNQYPFDVNNIDEKLSTWSDDYFVHKFKQNNVLNNADYVPINHLLKRLLVMDEIKCLEVSACLEDKIFSDNQYSFSTDAERIECFKQLKNKSSIKLETDAIHVSKHENKNYMQGYFSDRNTPGHQLQSSPYPLQHNVNDAVSYAAAQNIGVFAAPLNNTANSRLSGGADLQQSNVRGSGNVNQL